jgi:hypothetical protein
LKADLVARDVGSKDQTCPNVLDAGTVCAVCSHTRHRLQRTRSVLQRRRPRKCPLLRAFFYFFCQVATPYCWLIVRDLLWVQLRGQEERGPCRGGRGGGGRGKRGGGGGRRRGMKPWMTFEEVKGRRKASLGTKITSCAEETTMERANIDFGRYWCCRYWLWVLYTIGCFPPVLCLSGSPFYDPSLTR